MHDVGGEPRARTARETRQMTATAGADALVDRFYGRGGILDAIVRGVRAAGKDPERLEPADLAAVDEFHVRGRDATIELANRAALAPGLRVLDVGSGLGGTARYLASERQCHVIGVDVTQEYVDAANALTARVGLTGKVEFRHASATALPFGAGVFDHVFTEHVQRADDPSISFLAAPDVVRRILGEVGITALEWEDTSERSLEWVLRAVETMKATGPAPQPRPEPAGASYRRGPGGRRPVNRSAGTVRERRRR